ncbi:GNAT family N-acetyltransferase [Microbacterium sp. YY-03]|uniref:GNAT family N-acetyltransferase n=1 Tax=Microbacterium sp. YY-03 TaxID=3421636 RepID=UPI003D177DCA
MEQHDYAAWEPTLPASRDQRFLRWQDELSSLITPRVSIRTAVPTPEDARRMRDMQIVCEPITVLSLETNAHTINDRLALFAEIENVHVGFCVAFPGVKTSDPMFVQVVAVVPAAQRRGIGRELLAAAATTEPERDIVFATQESNLAAHAMSARFAGELGATLQRVNLGVYPDRYLGIQRGQGYRAWRVKRPR